MKNISKTILGVSTMIVIAGASIVPTAVSAWGDNTNGRASYNSSQINAGVLGNQIVFNSIKDNTVIGGDEKNFVAARYDNGNNGTNNTWNNDEITVEDGKTYVIRLYVHNDNPNGLQAVAEGVKATFSIPTEVSNSQTIVGYLDSTNAVQTRIWDEVTLTADTDFYLEYVDGSALWENNGMGSTKLTNDVITSGATLGYSSLDGKIPGCYEYDGVVTIRVTAHFAKNYTLNKQVRIKGTTEWQESVDAKIGDTVEYLIEYKNVSGKTVNNVMVQDILPANLKYVANSTKLQNATYPKSVQVTTDTLTTDGINIGGYTNNSNAYIFFQATVVNESLACGKTSQLVNWVKVTADNVTRKDDASVVVEGATCPVVKEEETQTKTDEKTETSEEAKTEKTETSEEAKTEKTTETTSEIVNTGAGEIVSSVLGAGSLTTALGYCISSRKKLM